MSIDSDVIRGHVDTIILKTLTTGDKYGYEIIKEIEQKSKGTYELKQPTLYSCLKRLENQGLISGFTKNSDIGGKRHYYKLTKKGRETYENSMNDWFNSRSIIDSLMGSKPTNLDIDTIGSSANNEQELEPSLEANTTQPEESEDKSTQMVLDGEIVVEESEPRDYDNQNIDEEDAQLLGDYYKTDENQINLFDENKTESEPHWTERLLHSSDDDENTQQDQDSFTSSLFKNYDGANVNSYKENSRDNYFESISYGIADTLNPQILNEEHENFATTDENEDDDLIRPSEPELIKNENSPFSSFSMFSHYNDFDKDEYDNSESDTDDTLSTYDSEENTEYENNSDDSETLNFGFGYTNDDPDEMNFPSSYMDISDAEETEPEQPSHISIFGEEENLETPETTESDYYIPENNVYEPQQSYQVEEFGDLKPYNIGNYTEPEYKEKLNQLSSYTKATYETKPVGMGENFSSVSHSVEELAEELSASGIAVRTYSRPSKEAIKEKKYLLVNKIKCVTSWIVFGIMSLLLLGTYFLAHGIGYTDLNLLETALPAWVYFAITALCLLTIPATHTIIFLFNKTKKIKPNYNAMISFVFALLFFIVCLNIVYTLNILNGFTKFTQTDYNHLLWLLPSVASLFILFQSAVYTILFRSKKFNA